jgi:hypothetical protein
MRGTGEATCLRFDIHDAASHKAPVNVYAQWFGVKSRLIGLSDLPFNDPRTARLGLSGAGPIFAAFTNDRHYFIRRNIQAYSLDVQRGVLSEFRLDHEDLPVFALYPDLTLFCRLLQQCGEILPSP